MEKQETQLKVMEALQEEAYKGIVRIDSNTMKKLGVRPGDIIEIEGSRVTVGVVDRAYPSDVGQSVIRMDGILRRNSKTGIGEIVKIRKADVKEAKNIIVAPAQKGIMIQAHPDIFKRGLLGRAVLKGDIVSIGGTRRRRRTLSSSPFFDDIFNVFEDNLPGGSFGLGTLKFIVAETNPKNTPIIITEDTEIKVSPKAVEITEEIVPDVTYEDIGGLNEEIKKIREMVEVPLRHPEIFSKLSIDPPKGVLLHGFPGTGKTLLAKAVANESEANFILINGPELINKFYGESEKRVRDIFEEAEKNAPSIIFIDEIDAIASKREESYGELERRVVSQLLCLHPNTPIYLKEGIKNIKNLFEHTTGKTFIDGNGVITKIPSKPIYVQSLSPSGKISNSKVIVLTKTDIPKAFKIKLENGAEITTSEITKFLSVDYNGVNWKNANNLSNEDFIFIPRRLTDTNKIQKIDIFKLKDKPKWILKVDEEGILRRVFNRKYISLEELYNLEYHDLLPRKKIRNRILDILIKEKEITKEKIESTLRINRAQLNNYLKPLIKNCLIKVNKSILELNIELTNLSEEIIGIARKEDKKIYPIKDSYFIKIPKIIDEDLVNFLGFIITDGNLGEYRVNISGETSKNALEICKRKFNVKTNLTQQRNIQRLDINSRALSMFLNQYFDIPIGKKSYKVKVPEQIFISPNSVKSAFLAGLIEGDGSIGKHGIRFHTKSKKLSLDISTLLLQLGILSKMKEYNVYTIKIAGGYESFEKFYNSIYLYIKLKKKKENLDRLMSRVKKVSTIIYPIKESLKKLRDNHSVRLDDNKYRYLSPNLTYNINSNVLGYFIQKLGHIENQFIQEIKHFYNSEAVPCKVLSIEEVEGGTMYDLTTEHSNFLAGDIPIIVHNTMMDGLKSRGKVIVIGATNRVNAIDPALRRPGRFDRELQIGVPDKKGRLNILKIHTRNMPLHEDINLKEIAEITHGFVGADIAALAKEAAMNVLRRLLPEMKLREKEPIPKDLLDKLIITKEDFKAALRIVRPSAMREVLVETPNVKWKDIGGLENVKQELIEAVEWPLKYSNSFKKLGIRPPRGILLYGPPGVGKTLMGKAVANESESNFILVRGPELIDKWVGSSEKGIRKIFEKARQTSPSIIFFDEIDSIAPRRGLEVGVKVTERIVNTLLSEIDGLEELSDVIVMATTNRPDLMDPALLRPGRFDRTILVSIPDEATRLEIFKIHTSKMPLAKDVNLQTLAKLTPNFVGADIENLCREAGILALRDDLKSKQVSMKYFKEALKKVKPSISQEQMEAYKMLEQKYLKAAKSATLKQEIPTYVG